MEKFFKHEGVMTHNKSRNIASNTNTDRNKRCLYQARDVGYEYNEKGYYLKTQNGTTYLLAYTKSGSAVLNYDGKEITLEEDSMLFLNLSNERIIKASESHWEIYFMHVTGSDIDEIYKIVANSEKGYYLTNYGGGSFMQCVTDIREMYNDEQIDYYEISGRIYLILMELMKKSKPVELDALIKSAKEFIDRNYSQPIKIEDLSKSLFVSKGFLIKRFVKETGYTPKEYLTIVRMDKAKQLLIQTRKGILEIALATGFENEKNIYYAFKSTLGISPKEYRENYT